MSGYKVPIEVVEKFLVGHDDEKYIVNVEYDNKTNLIHKIKHTPDGVKTIETEPLVSFMWLKDLSDIKDAGKFYGGCSAKIKVSREKYGITIKRLDHHNHDLLREGYRFLLTCEQGYDKMLDFFVKGGIFRGIYNPKYKDRFLVLSPVEQYLISTGKRLFKGYEDYSDIEKFVFDLETTGLNPEKDRIFLIGCKSNKGFEVSFDCEITGENADRSEAEAILKFFKAIEIVNPAIIAGYNNFNFDWDFLFKRCEKLNLNITEYAKTLKKGSIITVKEQKIKLGNEVETYKQVNMFGYSNIDIIHSARRAQAIDSNMANASLKYVCKYNKIAKPNRVYIRGKDISNIWLSTDKYYFDERSGSYPKRAPKIIQRDNITIDDIKKHDKKIFVLSEQTTIEDAFENINVYKLPIRNETEDFFNDDKLNDNKKAINKVIHKLIKDLQLGKTIVFPENTESFVGILGKTAPQTKNFIENTIKTLKTYCDSFTECDGRYIVKRYLMDDLWETMEVDNVYNQSSFMLAKLIPTTYQRITTMGTAGLWKMLMLTWSYEQNLPIPLPDTKRDFVGGLSRLLRVGYSKRLRKLDYNSLYPAIGLAHDLFPSVDVTGVLKSLLKYFHSERFKAKDLAKKYAKSGDFQLSSLYNRKQLPLKIFINSMYGALTAPSAFPWAEVNIGEQITCTARQYLRLMVKFFMKKNYTPTVLDTDGVNFSTPLSNDEKVTYIGKGLNDSVELGYEYTGIKACVAEFNDLYMQGEMALGLDGLWPATINIKRKNYVLLEDDGTISLTGNTIKSKRMPTYISDFLHVALKLLLDDKGYDFIQYYYEYIGKISNYEIPLAKIATKAKIKRTLESYNNRGVNKKGVRLPKQAHMELLNRANTPINVGDVVYYINNGVKKNDNDIQTIKKCKLTLKERREYKIEHGVSAPTEFYEVSEKINCTLLDATQIEDNPDMLGTYNIAKYINALNKRIAGLMVVFHPDIRGKVLINELKDKRSWLYSELELTNGFPLKPEDQDSLDELFTPSDMELALWNKVGYNPSFWFDEKIIFNLPNLEKVNPV